MKNFSVKNVAAAVAKTAINNLTTKPFQNSTSLLSSRAAAAGTKYAHQPAINKRPSSFTSKVPVYMSRQEALRDTYEELKGSEKPFFSKDMGAVCRQYNRWETNLPGIRPFYAIKCNPDPVILDTLAENGAGFDCATSAEIELALATGVSPNEIIFANPIKTESDLGFARSKDVKKMTFDNEDELYKIHKFFPAAELVLRLLPDDSGSLMRFGTKFGADEDVVPELLAVAQSLGLKVIGVSFHIGSGCFDPLKYDLALKMSRRVFDKALDMGLPAMTFLDVGGGFPGAPVDAHHGNNLPFERFASVIRTSMEEHFPSEEYPKLQRIGEPGRYFASHCGVLFTRVTGKRTNRDSNKVLYYVNDGVYGSFNCIMFDHQAPVPIPATEFLAQQEVLQEREMPTLTLASPFAPKKTAVGQILQQAYGFSTSSQKTTLGTFFGPTCDSMDKICVDQPVSELAVGDWVAFENMGAYTSAAASRFNGCPLAHVKYCHSLTV